MDLRNAAISSMRSLNKNRTRSMLTTIGVIVGVSSVIMMSGISNSARIEVNKKVSSFGKNGMRIKSQETEIRLTDIEKIKLIVPSLKYIAPLAAVKSVLVRYTNKHTYAKVNSTNNDLLKLREYHIARGREFDESDILYNKKVAIIGDSVREKLFGMEDCIGKTILVADVPYYIVGTVESLGQAFSGSDFDNFILIPYTTGAMKLVKTHTFKELYLSVENESDVDDAFDTIHHYFRVKHGLNQNEDDNFEMQTTDDKMQVTKYIWTSLTFLMIGVASISLIVGGVGIMNIMVVSVNERIREIGIRMAIGAKRRDILLQFLVESIILSAGGGIVGVVLGVSGYIIFTIVIDWHFIFSFVSVLVSFSFSILVGIFFGYYPARKASLLNPIDALRYE